MIKSIVKIKNCPSFIDYKPAGDLPEFKKYNLIYGWNGSGKTCFSRVLMSFEMGRNYYEYPGRQPEFEFKLDNETSISHDDLDAFKSIRVFNKDFIDESVFGIGGPKPIFFLGKESKEDKERIEVIEIKLRKLREKLQSEKSGMEKAKRNKDKRLQDKARDIKTALTTSKKDIYRNYDRSNLRKSIRNNTQELENPNQLKLSENRLTNLNKSIHQSSKPKITPLSIPNFDLSELEYKVNNVLSKTVASQVIEKLQADDEINKWVEDGLKIHKERTLEVCAFCEQKIPEDRLKDLDNHFSNEYQRVIQSLQELKDGCKSRRIKLNLPESSNFYDDLLSEYLADKKEAEKAIKLFNDRLDIIFSVLEQKEQNPFSFPLLEKTVHIEVNSFKKINEIVKKHNQKTGDFENQIEKNKKELELHYIASFFPICNELLMNFKDLKKECTDLIKAIEKKEKEIERLRRELISHHIPAQKINDDLQSFLGRKDIQLEATEDKEGYTITRNGELAKNLSEGEKTALAIVYFLTKINEEGFNLKKSVVVIDDPVSSLDSNAIFQAFSFIKESIKEAGQIFILTHHFDFFRQVKNWFSHLKKSERQFFMIVCSRDQTQRNSSILKIDKLLIEYESEYHFLFNILYKMANTQDQDLEKIYPIPNIARKFLESFLAFRVPIIRKNSKEPQIRQRLRHIKNIDLKKKERIRRFVETHSHPRYESGIQDFDMTILGETSEIVQDLIELIKKEDPKHYNFLVESIT